MKLERSSGILLHITSLPSQHGIGDFGSSAFQWLNFLADSGCGLWQILPLGPTGYGDSPYQCLSSFAGNPNFISPDKLIEDGLLNQRDLISPDFPVDTVDYARVIPWKSKLLTLAYENFIGKPNNVLSDAFLEFQHKNSHWLDDFTLYMTLKEKHQLSSWIDWEKPYRDRTPADLNSLRITHRLDIARHAFHQFLFYRQWAALHAYAKKLGIQVIGDLPLFVAYDSSDVWSSKHLFHLKTDGLPKFVAGVPPDYFSITGQLWGNPLYRWREHSKDGYHWWKKRLEAALVLVDIVRLDHFRGFVGYWQIPADALTAELGRWVAGPGYQFFKTLQDHFKELPIIAEDLGVITPDVTALREAFEFPSMKILQFGFSGDPDSPFLPHNYPQNCVVYTGTHDNDTTLGWYKRVAEEEREFYRRYLNRDGGEVAWDLIRACWSSVAAFAIAPLQDFLNLGNETRMNYPGSLGNNWNWRLSVGSLNHHLIERIRELNHLYSRIKK